MSIEHVLLDADGVLQRSAPDPIGLLRQWAGERAEDLGRALWTAERGPLRGEGDFLDVVDAVVPTYADVDPRELYRRLWHDITVSRESLDLVARLREAGYAVHLGTNQHRQRGQHMRTELGFDALFDESFYSWELGTKKPEPTYFELVLERIEADPAQVLFVDDMEVNVEAARAVGLRAEHWHLDRGHDALTDLLSRHGVQPAA